MSSRAFVRLGLVALPVAGIGLATLGGVGAGDATLAAALLITLPALAVAQLGVELPPEVDTLSIYLSSSILIALLGALAALAGAATPGVAAMGLGLPAFGTLSAGAAAAVGAGLAILVGARLVAARAGWTETELVRLVMPSDGTERAAFVLVSMIAGLGEEIAYRGFLLALLIAAFGDPLSAVALTSIAFGLLHAYQGPVGMVRTALIGVAFAGITLATGSLWPVVIGHVIINLVAGLTLGDWLLDTES